MIARINSTALTRKEREEHVLDLYFNQNKNYLQIAQEARTSPRDIGEIINREYKEKERQEHKSLFVQAYKLFSKGNTPLQVAIRLNIGEHQVSQYYTMIKGLRIITDY
jgi:DNA-directed RNA polymerase specialized sigma subunit